MRIYFSTVDFMKPKCISNISDENLVSELKYAVSVKFTLDFEDLVQKGDKILIFYIDYVLK